MREFIRLVADKAAGQQVILPELGLDIVGVVEAARIAFESLHEQRIDDQDGQEDRYRAIERSETVRRLRRAMDEWCAVWFWPADPESMAHVPTPLTFHRASEERSSLVARLAEELKFFHWELAFPDVFTPRRSGFDAMIGNPPWDVIEPSSLEFFSDFDPLFRTYHKQAAVRKQKELFETIATLADLWGEYTAGFYALRNWAKNVAEPYQTTFSRSRESDQLRRAWSDYRGSRVGYASKEHPFKLLGTAKLNSYKLFSEIFWNLTQPDGRIGCILPTGIYSDLGTKVVAYSVRMAERAETLSSRHRRCA